MVDIAGARTSRPTWPGGRVHVTRADYRPAPLEMPGSTVPADTQAITAGPQGGHAPAYEEIYRITGELPDGRWLYYALPVRVRIEGAEFVAIQPNLALHGFGETPMDAILNLREELVEHYKRLEEMGDRLAAPLIHQREFMRRLLTGRDA